jgi:hypothetical protein
MNRSQVGQKKFNINDDGLAHVGMLPDFIADLQQLGLQTKDIDPLFDAASDYVKLWGRSEAVARSLGR